MTSFVLTGNRANLTMLANNLASIGARVPDETFTALAGRIAGGMLAYPDAPEFLVWLAGEPEARAAYDTARHCGADVTTGFHSGLNPGVSERMQHITAIVDAHSWAHPDVIQRNAAETFARGQQYGDRPNVWRLTCAECGETFDGRAGEPAYVPFVVSFGNVWHVVCRAAMDADSAAITAADAVYDAAINDGATPEMARMAAWNSTGRAPSFAAIYGDQDGEPEAPALDAETVAALADDLARAVGEWDQVPWSAVAGEPEAPPAADPDTVYRAGIDAGCGRDLAASVAYHATGRFPTPAGYAYGSPEAPALRDRPALTAADLTYCATCGRLLSYVHETQCNGCRAYYRAGRLQRRAQRARIAGKRASVADFRTVANGDLNEWVRARRLTRRSGRVLSSVGRVWIGVDGEPLPTVARTRTARQIRAKAIGRRVDGPATARRWPHGERYRLAVSVRRAHIAAMRRLRRILGIEPDGAYLCEPEIPVILSFDGVINTVNALNMTPLSGWAPRTVWIGRQTARAIATAYANARRQHDANAQRLAALESWSRPERRYGNAVVMRGRLRRQQERLGYRGRYERAYAHPTAR